MYMICEIIDIDPKNMVSYGFKMDFWESSLTLKGNSIKAKSALSQRIRRLVENNRLQKHIMALRIWRFGCICENYLHNLKVNQIIMVRL